MFLLSRQEVNGLYEFRGTNKTEFDNCQVTRETYLRLMRGPDAGCSSKFSGQPSRETGKKIKKKRNVRACKTLVVLARLAFTSPGKNRDKQLTYIVRVSHSFHYSIQVNPAFLKFHLLFFFS